MSELNKYMMFIIFLLFISIVLQSITLYKASQKQERYNIFDTISNTFSSAYNDYNNAISTGLSYLK